MEKFLPILKKIQTVLSTILKRYERNLFSWDLAEIRDIGEDLVQLSTSVWRQLIQVKHKVLYYSIRQAGLGIRHWAEMVQKRELNEDDKKYFKTVYEMLKKIFVKIETGEYYNALLEISVKNKKAHYIV
jgi:hypothetical protein